MMTDPTAPRLTFFDTHKYKLYNTLQPNPVNYFYSWQLAMDLASSRSKEQQADGKRVPHWATDEHGNLLDSCGHPIQTDTVS